MNIHKGCAKVLLDRKFALNSPTSALKDKIKRRNIELIRLRQESFIVKRVSFVRFICQVSFCILFIWVCLIISIIDRFSFASV